MGGGGRGKLLPTVRGPMDILRAEDIPECQLIRAVVERAVLDATYEYVGSDDKEIYRITENFRSAMEFIFGDDFEAVLNNITEASKDLTLKIRKFVRETVDAKKARQNGSFN